MSTSTVTTVVEVTVASKKEIRNWDTKNPSAFEIEFDLPYDQNSIFYKMSGGTNAVLRTINAEAAAQFKIGDKVRWTLEVVPPAPEEVIETAVV